MRIALLGATGSIGSAVLAAALDAGHEVRALVRSDGALPPEERLSVVRGDAESRDDVSDLVAGNDVVISTLGPRDNNVASVKSLETIAQNVITAMHQSNVRRLVFVAGAGLSLPGERRTTVQRIASMVVRIFARWIVLAKQREMDLYRTSGVEWSAVRPTRVRPGRSSGRVRITYDRPAGFTVTSGDVATVILQLAEDSSLSGRAPFVSTPG